MKTLSSLVWNTRGRKKYLWNKIQLKIPLNSNNNGNMIVSSEKKYGIRTEKKNYLFCTLFSIKTVGWDTILIWCADVEEI